VSSENRHRTEAARKCLSFLSTQQIQSVQHELRTPIHGMLALISSLTADMKTEIAAAGNEQRVNDINSLGSQLLKILDDFRDFVSEAGS
jgi:signal transduction histidine kinase